MNQRQTRKPAQAEAPDPSLQGLGNTGSNAQHLRDAMNQIQEQNEKFNEAIRLIKEQEILKGEFTFKQTIGQ